MLGIGERDGRDRAGARATCARPASRCSRSGSTCGPPPSTCRSIAICPRQSSTPRRRARARSASARSPPGRSCAAPTTPSSSPARVAALLRNAGATSAPELRQSQETAAIAEASRSAARGCASRSPRSFSRSACCCSERRTPAARCCASTSTAATAAATRSSRRARRRSSPRGSRARCSASSPAAAARPNRLKSRGNRQRRENRSATVRGRHDRSCRKSSPRRKADLARAPLRADDRQGALGHERALLPEPRRLHLAASAPPSSCSTPRSASTTPDAFRGMPVLVQLENGQPKCVACGLCEFACPTDCITIVPGELDERGIERYPRAFDIDMSRCMFCGLCEEACPEEAIVMSREVELGAFDRDVDALPQGAAARAGAAAQAPPRVHARRVRPPARAERPARSESRAPSRRARAAGDFGSLGAAPAARRAAAPCSRRTRDSATPPRSSSRARLRRRDALPARRRRARFDMLIDLTAVDYLGRASRASRSSTTCYSLAQNHRVRVKARVPEKPRRDRRRCARSGLPRTGWSARSGTSTAIRFRGHPDLRRILLYEEFEGHPLRKDYPKERRQPLVGPRN